MLRHHRNVLEGGSRGGGERGGGGSGDGGGGGSGDGGGGGRRPCVAPTNSPPEYRTEPRVSSSTQPLAIERGHTGWYFISQKKDPPNCSIRSDEHRKRLTLASEAC